MLSEIVVKGGLDGIYMAEGHPRHSLDSFTHIDPYRLRYEHSATRVNNGLKP